MKIDGRLSFDNECSSGVVGGDIGVRGNRLLYLWVSSSLYDAGDSAGRGGSGLLLGEECVMACRGFFSFHTFERYCLGMLCMASFVKLGLSHFVTTSSEYVLYERSVLCS